jgi:hypothetical protein
MTVSRAQTIGGELVPIVTVGVMKWWAVCDAEPTKDESWTLVKATAVVKRNIVLGPFDSVEKAKEGVHEYVAGGVGKKTKGGSPS